MGDIYAQKIHANGTLLWDANGTPICTEDGAQTKPYICSDEAGGAIVVWRDSRDDIYGDIYAQKIIFDGTTSWQPNGTALCNLADFHSSARLCSDGAGGAIFLWQDSRTGVSDIYVQYLTTTGVAQWGANGTVICNASGNQWYSEICATSGGAVIVWSDQRTGTDSSDIYAQKINLVGTNLWGANGTMICAKSYDQILPELCSDGAGGAVITWQDNRTGINYDIYAQHMSSAGSNQWTTHGIAVCTATNRQFRPVICSNGSGSAIITWQDERNGEDNDDIYAQLLSSAGVPQWTANGLGVCTELKGQWYPALTCDGKGGAIITWQDNRTDSGFQIYAQQVPISAAGGIPGFALLYLIVGFLALVSIYFRKKFL
jgi:hypothetical protein